MTPGLVGMVIMWANLFVGTRLVEWRQKGVLRRLAVTGLRPIELLATQAAAHLLFSLAQAAVMLILTAFLVFRVTVQRELRAAGVRGDRRHALYARRRLSPGEYAPRRR